MGVQVREATPKSTLTSSRAGLAPRAVEADSQEQTILEIQASFCRTMGNPTRLQIVRVLQGQELTVSDIAGRLRLAQPTISQHLAVLRNMGLVLSRRDGKHTFYRLYDPDVAMVCDMVRDIIARLARERKRLFDSDGDSTNRPPNEPP